MVIIGGGPGGYEAALVASQLGGEVTLVEENGVGGAAVLTDCVPSKTLIATAEVMTSILGSEQLGLTVTGAAGEGRPSLRATVSVDLQAVNQRVLDLAGKQSRDITERLGREGVRVVNGRGRLDGAHRVVADTDEGEHVFDADFVLLATGTRPRQLPDGRPDGERILTWQQLYTLDDLPERLVVVGSGVTGAEFASAYDALGVDVVLVSSRDQVLPGEDPDAARVLQEVMERRGVGIMARSRAASARRVGDGVEVTLTDGRTVSGSHCLMAVGSIPNTAGIGLEEAGIALTPSGHIRVDKVSRTSARGVYAAGDCTGVLPLASVAAMQGRIAMWHALGDAVAPLDLNRVSANVFTSPEIATVGVSQADVSEGRVPANTVNLPLRGNARAKMQGIEDGFVKIFSLPRTGIIVGGVVVAPSASELIHPLSLAVAEQITVDEFAGDFTVYPSLSGSLAEAARRLHRHSITTLGD